MKQNFKKTYSVLLDKLNNGKQLSPVNLIDYLSNTAGSHSESLGFSLESLYKKGYSWILLSWNIKIEQLPVIEEKFQIETWISKSKRCFAYREFLVRNSQSKIIINASSRWVFYNIKKRKPAKIFPEFSAYWTINPEKSCNKFILDTPLIKQSVNNKTEHNLIVQKEDIDILNHVHNSKYIDWVLKIKPKAIHEKYMLKHLQANYHHETKYPGEVIIRQQFMKLRKNNRQLGYDEVFNKNEQRISAEIATEWELI